MAKCQTCGKTTAFGRSIPWSKKASRRTFKPNLQRVMVFEGRHKEQKLLCTRCIRTMSKGA